VQITIRWIIFAAALLLVAGHGTASTAISYQGRLDAGGQAFDGTADMVFELYDAESGGSPVGSPAVLNGVPVAQGLFQVELDFGAQPYDAGLWLQLSVDGQALTPRQRLRAAPLAVHALSDATAAGTGLELVGTELSIGSGFRLPQFCSEGEVVKLAGSGEWDCAVDESANYTGSVPVQVDGTEISLVPGSVSNTFIAPLTLTDGQIAPDARIDPVKIDGTAATLSGDQVFDNGTLSIDAGQDRIGIGTSQPEATLDVRGDIELDGDLRLRSPRTYSINVSGAAYRPTDIATEDDHLSTNESGGYLYMGGNLDNPGDTALAADAIAPISLPAGATVTRLTCDFYDSTTADDLSGTAYLTRRTASNTFGSTMASVSLSTTGIADTNIQSSFDDTISSPATIDPADYLWMRVRIQTGSYSGLSLRFYGCSVEYTIESL